MTIGPVSPGHHARCGADCAEPTTTSAHPGRRLLRYAGLLLTTIVSIAFIAAIAAVPGHRRARRGAWALHRCAGLILRSVGVRLVTIGSPRSGPSLVVGNHISWLDILGLAASAPMVMVAKSELRSWPLLGRTSARVGTLFLQRASLRALPGSVAEITAALRAGSRVQVFPEATTRCGRVVGEFHRAAFQAAIDAAVVVSPVAIRYTDSARSPITAPAFLGEETLLGSVRRVLASPSTVMTVRWLPAIPAIAGTGRDFIDRATATRLTQNAIARSLAVPVVARGQSPARPALPSPVRR